MVEGKGILERLPGYRLVDTTRFPHIGLYAYNGLGKTYFCATATKVPELCPVCLIAIKKSDSTLVGKSDIDLGQLVLLDPAEHMRKAKVSNMWNAIEQVCRKVRDTKPFPFGCVILDDLTTAQFWAEERAKDESPFHPDGSTNVLFELTQQGDYRLAKSRLIDIVMDLVEVCDKNRAALFWTAQERNLEIVPEGEPLTDERGNLIKVYKSTAALMPSLIQDIMGTAVVVGRMRSSGTQFILETRRSQYRDAVDRTGLLSDPMSQPTVAKVLGLLRKGGWKIEGRTKEEVGE